MKEKSAIRQMLYGQRGNFQLIELTTEYKELKKKYCEIEDEFESKLKEMPELYALYLKVCDANDDKNSEIENTYYAEGFRFGLLIGLDAAGLLRE